MGTTANLAGTVIPIQATDGRTEIFPGITAGLEQGVVSVFSDTTVTHGCPGSPDSELQLWNSARTWAARGARDLPLELMQFGFDEDGELQLITAFVNPSDSPRRGGFLRSLQAKDSQVSNIRVAISPCTLIRFTAEADEDGALLSAVAEWLEAHQDFAVITSQLGHDSDGRRQYLLVLEGWEPESL